MTWEGWGGTGHPLTEAELAVRGGGGGGGGVLSLGYITWAHRLWGHIAELRRIGRDQCPQFMDGEAELPRFMTRKFLKGQCLGLPREEGGITQRHILTGIRTSRQQG